MTRPFAAHVQGMRESARTRAGTALAALGFTGDGDRWAGNISLSDGSSLPVHVALPPSFPDALPEVFLRFKPSSHIAHVERSGKICIAPKSGILIDADRPEAIVTQALSKAAAVLQKRNSADQPQELASEFLAYWSEPAPTTLLSTCPPDSATGPVCLVRLSKNGSLSLAAPSRDAASDWTGATGKQITAVEDAFFIRLDSLPPLPSFGERTTLRGFLSLVDANAAPDGSKALKAWLKSHGFPATVMLSAPLNEKGHVEFACTIPKLSPRAAAKVERGFRKGHVPNAIIVPRASAEPVVRLGVSRVDPGYVLPRGGADPLLREKTVAIVGCGSVGSHVAQALAVAGVGTLVLIDPDILLADNIHRHVLGAAHIGQLKTAGLEMVLRGRFPHLLVKPFPEEIESILDVDKNAVLCADLIILALGDETLERRLNALLHGETRRIHVWLEPLGVGGHVLSLAKEGTGCLACLYRRDDTYGLVNMASLVEPGQSFQQSLAGCAGTFTPFGSLDAEEASLHASREAIAVLRGERVGPSLLSWASSKEHFLTAGHRLSRLGQSLAEETLDRKPHFARSDCPICGVNAE